MNSTDVKDMDYPLRSSMSCIIASTELKFSGIRSSTSSSTSKMIHDLRYDRYDFERIDETVVYESLFLSLKSTLGQISLRISINLSMIYFLSFLRSTADVHPSGR